MPDVDCDVIESMPAIVENCFSSGVATADAIVSGLAPGRLADTWIVGKSTLGSALTGSSRYETMPKIRMPSMTSAVITGARATKMAPSGCSSVRSAAFASAIVTFGARREAELADRHDVIAGLTPEPTMATSPSLRRP